MSSEIFSRQSFLGENSETAFTKTTIAIIGLGGGGSHIAQQAAHIGFNNIHLVDPQIFDSPNLNRTVGAMKKDIGITPKIEIAARTILGINPGANVFLHQCEWQNVLDYLCCVDIIFGSLDGYRNRDELECFSRRYLIPYIDIGMDVHATPLGHVIAGQVITSIPNQLCMRCMGYITNKRLTQEAANYGSAGPNPQVIWPNGVLASLAIGNAIKILTPWHNENEICPFIEYDGNAQTVNPSNLYLATKSTQCTHFNSLSNFGNPFVHLK